MGLFSKTIGLDLGTVNTRIYKEKNGIVLSEPSVVAVDRFSGKIMAVGKEANEMVGRTPDNIVAVRPMRDGVIADFDVTRAMLRQFINLSSIGGVLKPKAVIAIPVGITEVEKRAVEEAAITSGIKSVVFVEKPMAAALGAGVNVDETIGNMVIDIGGGTTEVAVISLGGIVSAKSIRVAGDAMDSAIINYVKKEFGIIIGDRMAEDVKLEIGNAYDIGEEKIYTVRGRDVSTGLPKQENLTSQQIREAMHENFMTIIEAVKYALEHTPPELASDIMEKGIVLTGGGAEIAGLSNLIKHEINIDAKVSENANTCVVRGTGIMINRPGR